MSLQNKRDLAKIFQPPQKYIAFSAIDESKLPPPHPYRSYFARDRDTILYHKSLLRLSAKTQIVTHGKSDHVRNRLTHTLEVSQIARTIAGILGLNVDLAEAISLGHDIGHTPFGHVGERTLHMLTNGCDKASVGYVIPDGYHGFKHNLHSARMLIELPDKFFTNYTLFGIKHHSSPDYNDFCSGFTTGICSSPTTSRQQCVNSQAPKLDYYEQYEPFWSYEYHGRLLPAWSLEAFVVQWADEIAQRHHDTEDAIRLNLISLKKLLENEEIQIMNEFVETHRDFLASYAPRGCRENLQHKWEKSVQESGIIVATDLWDRAISSFGSFIVDFYVTFIAAIFNYQVSELKKRCKNAGAFSKLYPDISLEKAEMMFGRKMKESPNDTVKAFAELDKRVMKALSAYIILSYNVQALDGKGGYIIRSLAKAYLTNPQQLPDRPIIEAVLNANQALIKSGRPPLVEAKDDIGVMPCRKLLRQIRSNDPSFATLRTHLLRAVCHYIANMTDRYALEEYQRLYG